MRVVLFANSAWYLYNFRLALARALRSSGHDVVLVSPRGTHGEALRAEGFRWVEAPMERRSLGPLQQLRTLLWLRRFLVEERIDLIHNFTIKCAVLGSFAARTARAGGGVPRVNAITGMGFAFTSERWLARLLRPVVRVLLRSALGGTRVRVILQNPDDVGLVADARLADPGVVRMIKGSGVDCARFSPAPEDRAARPAGRVRVVLPARLLWDKGIAEFVEAARILRSEARSIEFLVAGTTDPGNPASVPEGVVGSWRAEGVVTLLGHVDAMPELLRGADIVALPSHREGLPRSLIEAGACAKAIVTTDVPGCREVVAHGKDGLLVPPRDPVALARAIARLADDPALRGALGQAARSKALAEFDERIVIERTAAVYAELVG